jgi:lipoyl(octanoyl) transferase
MSHRDPMRAAIEWAISDEPVAYPTALNAMQLRATEIANGHAAELVWLLEHPALFTAGTSAKIEDLLDPNMLPVFATGRGGQYTYHGPGQRIAYVMLNVQQRGCDVRRLVSDLERWVIGTLAAFNVKGETRPGRVGIWVGRPERGLDEEDKIAAIGLRVSRGVTTHGISLNVEPDLAHYRGIVPCGIQGHGVTSLADLGRTAVTTDVDLALRRTFEGIFGPAFDAAPPVYGAGNKR